MLSQQLHDLEDCGMIHREVIPEKPPKTIYSLTSFGCSIIPVLEAMCQWGNNFLDGLDVQTPCCQSKNRKWVWLIISSPIPILLLNLRLPYIITQCGKVNIWILIQNLFQAFLCLFVQFRLFQVIQKEEKIKPPANSEKKASHPGVCSGNGQS